MSTPQPPRRARLVIGLLMGEKSNLATAARQLSDRFGSVDLVSEWMDFGFTDYYAAEMGSPLFRRMLSFVTLVDQDALAGVKVWTNDLEASWTSESQRRINIDPGILTLERFVLATGKNFTHRIYLDQGIFADLTLVYTQGDFKPLPWTYPDYRSEGMIRHMRRVRQRYVHDMRRDS